MHGHKLECAVLCARAPGYFEVFHQEDSKAAFSKGVFTRLLDLVPSTSRGKGIVKVTNFFEQVDYLAPPILPVAMHEES